MKNIKANISIVLEVPDERAEEIFKGNVTAFLGTLYTPSDERGKWWVDGECVVENGTKINVR